MPASSLFPGFEPRSALEGGGDRQSPRVMSKIHENSPENGGFTMIYQHYKIGDTVGCTGAIWGI